MGGDCPRSKTRLGCPEQLLIDGCSLPQFVTLPKTTKDYPFLNLRINKAIIGSNKAPAAKLSTLIARLLSPLLTRVSAHLKDTTGLLDVLEGLNRSSANDRFCFSLDVKALYTSAPTYEAIEIATELLQKEGFRYFGLNHLDIKKLLFVISGNYFFEYNGRVYKQIRVLQMGCPFSGFLAILFMDILEKKLIFDYSHLITYY